MQPDALADTTRQCPANGQHTASTNQLWTHQGPPEGRHTVHPTHSWFYVLLLLAGTNRLQPEATAAWQQTTNTGQAWHRLVMQLQTAAPIPWQLLQHILATLQDIATASGQRLAAAENNLPAALRAAGSTQPSGTLVHLPWAVELCQQPGGYIPATAQEALLQAFLGEQQASAAATLAQQWHSLARNPGPAEPTPHPANGVAAEGPPASPPPTPRSNASESDSSSTTTSATASSSSIPTADRPAEDAPQPGMQANPSTIERRHRQALASLDSIDAHAVLQQKCFKYKQPPSFLRGLFRTALSTALGTILAANTEEDNLRAWKLWCLLPRMLLHWQCGVRTLPKPVWRARFAQFEAGQWTALLHQAATQASSAPPPPHDAANPPTASQSSPRPCSPWRVISGTPGPALRPLGTRHGAHPC